MLYIGNQKNKQQCKKPEQRKIIRNYLREHRSKGKNGKKHGNNKVNQPFVLKKANLNKMLFKQCVPISDLGFSAEAGIYSFPVSEYAFFQIYHLEAYVKKQVYSVCGEIMNTPEFYLFGFTDVQQSKQDFS